MSTVLVMLSGGVDSTNLLHYYLTQTDHKVHAHHISMQYPHVPRWKMEKQAVDNIVDYCRQHFRDFEFSSSHFGIDTGRNFGMDSDLQLLVASKVAPNLSGSSIEVALGWCSEDLTHPVVADRMKRHITSNLWHALWESISDNKHIARDLSMPLLTKTKEELLQAIPKELLRLCWSCRNGRSAQSDSTVFLPCGICHACKFNRKALDSIGLDRSDFPNLISSKKPAPQVQPISAPPPSSVAGKLNYRIIAKMEGSLPHGDKAKAPVYSLYPPPVEFNLSDHTNLTPCRTDINLNGQLAFLIDNVLTEDEADMLITMSEKLGYSNVTPGIYNPPGVRLNKAVHWISDDTFLGAVLRRVKHLLPETIDGCHLYDLSQRVNMYKYDSHDAFNKHLDGHWPGFGLSADAKTIIEWPETETKMTLLLYLNGPADGIRGGVTRLFSPAGNVIDITPKKGSALCFRHGYGDQSVLHEGTEVLGDVPKYVAKINVAYSTKTSSNRVRLD